MIAYLSGLVFKKATDAVIIDANGIGYEVIVPLSTFYQLPDEAGRTGLHIYTHVREDTLALFGFHTKLEKSIFLMLIAVSGIGPKLAINILSGIGPQDLLDAIAHGDSIRLQAIPGVGKKTAERIALELKDRALKVLGQTEIPVRDISGKKENRLIDDALSALLNLGYSSKFTKPALDKARSGIQDMTLEGLIREALRLLA